MVLDTKGNEGKNRQEALEQTEKFLQSKGSHPQNEKVFFTAEEAETPAKGGAILLVAESGLGVRSPVSWDYVLSTEPHRQGLIPPTFGLIKAHCPHILS